MLRAPEDIAQLKSSVGQAWNDAMPEIEAAYAARRTDADPATLAECLEQRNDSHDEFALTIARDLMGHTDIGRLLIEMQWLVLDTSQSQIPLLTSDRPVWMTPTLTEDDAFIIMPIGPTKLFAATVHVSTKAQLAGRHKRDLVKTMNKLTVQHAVKFVYGQTDSMLSFVQEHMATKRHSTLLERVASFRGQAIVAQDSPAKKP